MKPFQLGVLIPLLTAMVMFGCGQQPQDPLPAIRKEMAVMNMDTYSIILSDMQADGNFIKSYTHGYRVITPEKEFPYGPMKVPEKMYEYYRPYLGMTIWSQKDGKGEEIIAPPGYAFVGDSRYGEWRTDSSGKSFWHYYGQYRLFSDLLGFGGPIYRNHYRDYQSYRSSNRPYYGPNNAYGTGGAATRKQYPDFFQRQQTRAKASSTSFANKVNQRIGRSRTSSRGRGSSGGK